MTSMCDSSKKLGYFTVSLRSTNIAAEFAGLSKAQLQHVLVTEYPPGSAIGWQEIVPSSMM